MAIYTPTNWYWVGPLGVFSSAAQSIVASSDPTYTAWLAAGNFATNWPKDAAENQTAAALDAVLAPYGLVTGLNFSSMQQELEVAASNACSFVVSQVTPDSAHSVAVQNAASIVNANGGAAPTTGPLAAKFAAMATAFLAPSAAAFAALVVAVQGASLDLSTALANLNIAAATATTPTQLAAALLVFEGAISTVVSEINAVVPVPISAPPAITIKGINS